VLAEVVESEAADERRKGASGGTVTRSNVNRR
jgi:hypothetical protein